MTCAGILRCYRALGPLPNPPGERSWVQRVGTERLLFKRWQEVADYFREMIDGEDLETIRADLGKDCPPLFDLLLEAFPRSVGQ